MNFLNANKRKRLIGTFLLANIIFAFACDKIPNASSEFSREISIVCMLTTSQAPHKLYAFYTAPLDSEPVFIQNAEVLIHNSDQQVQFFYHYDSLLATGYYSDFSNPLNVLPNVTYNLIFIAPEGDTVSGKTVVPDKFRIIKPDNGPIEISNSLEIIWTKSKTAWGYVINLIYPAFEYPPGSGHFIQYQPASFQTEDTSYVIPDFINPRPGKYVLKVMAYDKNYYYHVNGMESNGIENGYGVFSSAVVDSVVFFVQ